MEVAEEVTDRIEIAVQQLGQLDEVNSNSKEGLSIVTVDIKPKYDKTMLPQIWDELRRKVNDCQGQLPPGAGPSVVNDDYGDVYGILYAIYGDGYSYAELKDHVDLLRRELLLVQDVGKVGVFGDLPETIYLEFSTTRMAQLGVSPEMLVNTISGQNMIVPSGKIEVGSSYLRIQPSGGVNSVEDIGNLLVLQPDGKPSKIYIKDIAKVFRDYQDPPNSIIRFNGRPAIGLGISTVIGGNVVTMGEGIKKRLHELEEQTPVGIEMGVISMQSDAVQTAISGFVVSLIQAVIIVIAVLIFAMGLRSSLVIGGILLLTVLGTFMIMKSQGVMLERISLGALIIALGMLVDNAIVVVEGIIVNSQKGMSKTDAAISIVKQTMWPLFGATIVAILAFAAIGASQDNTGEYCRSLYQVILYSLTLSWVLAITLTPLFGVMYLKAEPLEGESADPYSGKLFQGYKKSADHDSCLAASGNSYPEDRSRDCTA
jgi:multidrug efflux pump subunit AcrB